MREPWRVECGPLVRNGITRLRGHPGFATTMKLFQMPALRAIALFRERSLREVLAPPWLYSGDHESVGARARGRGAAGRLAGARRWTTSFIAFAPMPQYGVCNWMVEADTPDPYCAACRHNRTVPDTSIAENVVAWRKIEIAKHMLFYTLMKLHLPLDEKDENGDSGCVSISWRARRRRRAARDDRPRQRPDHARARRSRRRRAREAAHHHARALSHAGRPFPPRGRALFLGRAGARRRPLRGLPRRFRRRDGGLRRGAASLLRQWRAAELAGQFHQRLCDLASVGGFCRDLGALPAHRRYAGNGARLRHVCASAAGRARRARCPCRLSIRIWCASRRR